MQINSLNLNKFENMQTAKAGNTAVNQTKLMQNYRFGSITKANQVAFKGGLPSKAYGKLTDGIANVLGKLASSKFSQNVVKFLSGESENKVARWIGKKINVKEKWFQHAIALESIYLTSFYMYNTKKSKAIPEEQKRPMMINQALVTTLCTALGYTIDSKINKVFNKYKEVFVANNVIKIAESMKSQVAKAVKAAKSPEAIENAIKIPLKKASGIANGISKLKSVLVFGFIYRYFSPVFITPIANRVSELWDKKDKTQKSADKTKTSKAA